MTITRQLLVLVFVLMLVSSPIAAASTFYVNETDLVRIRPEAIDPDLDNVIYYFPPPLNEEGVWQTGYDDAGEYPLEIIASDGKSNTTQDILLIVREKNRPPILTTQEIVVKETQTVDLKEIVQDPDNNVLTFRFSAPFNTQGVWQTGFSDEGRHSATFQVDDGEAEVTFRVAIIVEHTNQAPRIRETFSTEDVVVTKEDEIFSFFVNANDSDNEEISYRWKLDGKQISQSASGEYYFDFESAGEHLLSVTVADAISNVEQSWNMRVENKNRKPLLTLLPLNVREGEVLRLELPQKDLDGDRLRYSFEAPLNESGQWLTGYEDAGNYKIKIRATDGELMTTESLKITVLDVDRAPLLLLPEIIKVKEGKEVLLGFESSDPDGDNVEISFENVPEGAEFDEETGELEWVPGYDVVQRKGGMVSNFLNRLRVEHLILPAVHLPFTVTSCGKELCSSKNITFIVENVNRAPEIISLYDITAKEGENFWLPAEAVDPDGDIVRYYFSSPLKRRAGSWQPGYDAAGRYTIYVTATDGRAGETKPATVTILETNREPRLIIDDSSILVNEEQEFTLPVRAEDPDNDNVSIGIRSLPPGASFGQGSLVWKPSYNTVVNKSNSIWNDLVSNSLYLNKRFNPEQETRWVELIANDGEFEVIQPVKITVKNVNRAPRMIDFLPATKITARTGQPVLFHVVAKDDDNDALQYTWDFELGDSSVHGTDTIERTFTTAGEKKVTVSISDGRDAIEKEWVIAVSENGVQQETQPLPFTIKVLVIES